MHTHVDELAGAAAHPVIVHVEPALVDRNRLTTAFRPILAIPHLILVGGPLAVGMSLGWSAESGGSVGAGGGVLGVVALVAAIFGWFAIVFTGSFPRGLEKLAMLYLEWRVRAVAYTALLRDEYPPFGEGVYPAWLEVHRPREPRDRVTVAFRVVLALPHIVALWALSFAWGLTTLIAWLAILLTGRYPAALYAFAVGVLRWNTRVEAYLLLLHDEYPPFSLE